MNTFAGSTFCARNACRYCVTCSSLTPVSGSWAYAAWRVFSTHLPVTSSITLDGLVQPGDRHPVITSLKLKCNNGLHSAFGLWCVSSVALLASFVVSFGASAVVRGACLATPLQTAVIQRLLPACIIIWLRGVDLSVPALFLCGEATSRSSKLMISSFSAELLSYFSVSSFFAECPSRKSLSENLNCRSFFHWTEMSLSLL